jgi:hypothetical protein
MRILLIEEERFAEEEKGIYINLDFKRNISQPSSAGEKVHMKC